MGLAAPASDQPTPPARWSSAAAADYDAWFQTPWGRHAFAVESAAVLRAAGALDGARVLDVGCGTGRFTGALEQAGAMVVGVDLDPGMLIVAAANHGGPRLVADAHRLPFATGAFDLAVALTLLEFVDDPARVVAELARVTRPGGRLLVGALNRASPWGLAHRRRLRHPPWTAARFLTRSTLRRLGRAHGTARAVPYVVEVRADTSAYPEQVRPTVAPHKGRGRRPRPRYRHQPSSLKQLAMAAGQRSCVELIWRRGSKGLQRGRFLALRVRPAGVAPRRLARAAGEELQVRWLLVEWPVGKLEPTKYWLSSLPQSTPLVDLVGLARLRWRVEQDYRELKGRWGWTISRAAASWAGITTSRWSRSRTAF
jgi:SAM-dependent methyltransferase